jgi:hypothetical protein
MSILGGMYYLYNKPKVAVAFPMAAGDVEADFERTWNALTEKWLTQLGGSGWVYYAFKVDLAGDNGVDPNIGWPLPNRSLDEYWFKVDASGQIKVILTRRTDLDRGNVWLASWMKDVLVLHYPEKNVEMGDDSWGSLEAYLNSGALTFGKPTRIVTLELVDDGGRALYMAKLRVMDEAMEVGGPVAGTFRGVEVVEIRDAESGAFVSGEQSLINEQGERVVIYREYDYHIEKVPAPPDEMLALLEQR